MRVQGISWQCCPPARSAEANRCRRRAAGAAHRTGGCPHGLLAAEAAGQPLPLASPTPLAATACCREPNPAEQT